MSRDLATALQPGQQRETLSQKRSKERKSSLGISLGVFSAAAPTASIRQDQGPAQREVGPPLPLDGKGTSSKPLPGAHSALAALLWKM